MSVAGMPKNQRMTPPAQSLPTCKEAPTSAVFPSCPRSVDTTLIRSLNAPAINTQRNNTLLPSQGGHQLQCFLPLPPPKPPLQITKAPIESSPRERYSCLENPVDIGVWQGTVHRVAKSQTQLKRLSMHTLEHKGADPSSSPTLKHLKEKTGISENNSEFLLPQELQKVISHFVLKSLTCIQSDNEHNLIQRSKFFSQNAHTLRCQD